MELMPIFDSQTGMKTQTNELENPLFKKHNFHNKQKKGKQIWQI